MHRLKLQRRTHATWRLVTASIGRLLCLLAMSAASVQAGTMLDEALVEHKQHIEIQLRGATEFGAVRLFEHLLDGMEAAAAVEPTGMHLEPDNPQACRASWQVRTDGVKAALVVEQLVAIIKELDQSAQNEVLYEAPFIVTEGDLALVKRAEPVVTGPDSAVFVIASSTGTVEALSAGGPMAAGNRWHLLRGGGFD